MAERLATMFRVSLFVLAIGSISAKRFSIMAPNVFHIGVKEKVSISVFDTNIPTTVKLYLEDYPHRQKRFSEVEGLVDQGSNIFLPVKVEPKDLPDIASVDKQYVYLVAKSDDAHFQFYKEAKILLSYKTGMVFIQTDKPIYTPKQTVEIRVIPIEVDMRPSRRQITVIVENPQGIRVNEWRDLNTTTGIISHLKIDLAEFVLLGNWTITAFYGHGDKHNTSAQFEVKEYVLPKFSVKLMVPPYIMKTDYEIKIKILARYTYGKPVVGNVLVTLSIVGSEGQIVPFGRHLIFLHNSGETPVKELVQRIRTLPGGLWFPENRRLQVQADVIDRSTGNKESAVDESCQFTSSPYLVEFKNTPKYFKPGFNFDVKVVVTYPNKQPARRVRVLIAANGTQQDGTMIVLKKFDRNDPNVWEVTDELGQADFTIHGCSNCPFISIKVKTDDENLEDPQNAVGIVVVTRFDAENGNSIMVRQENSKELGKVGSKMTCQIHRDPRAGAIKVSLAVVSRGRILSHDTIDSLDGGKIRDWSFFVSPQMSPSARLIAYYIDNRERVVADSILLNIEDSLLTKVYFPDALRAQDNKIEKEPASSYTVQINATQGTRVVLLAVDESVYLLRNENRLTKERIFKTAEELDLGCDVGGGKNNRDIFKNAGVVLMTNNFVSDGREDYGCNEDVSRKKRSAEKTLEDKVCCDMGKENGNDVTCVKVIMDGTKRLSKRCREIFWKCCTELYGTKDTAMLGRNAINSGDFDSPERNVGQHQVRSFFPETWIYTEGVVGPGGVFQMKWEIPHTITTWVMQAVAINNKTGLGLATPLRIVGYQDFFVSLRMPYSVKRGEQISLLVTVFNYFVEKFQVDILLKGHRDFCSIAKDEQLALIGKVTVKPNDASSVAVPIIPKRIGEVEIEVHANILVDGSIYGGGDAVKRKLLVVPEGKEHRKSQSFILDPSGNLNDGPKDGEKKAVQPTQAPFQSQTYLAPDGQHDSIELKVPKEAIPDSVRVIVYVTGNLLGPVVNTTIEGGLEKFFTQPTGCGEQNMIYLAPNVYVLEYLMNTNLLTGANEENAYRFIQSGYERELNYRRDDKSFSAWGNDRPGSTWLTAFVMKVFCKSQQFPGINIDDRVVCESVKWLIQNQRADGALPEVHMVIHKEMVGGVYTEGDAVMTAFVLSTLAECKCKEVNSQAAMLRATDFLEKQYKTLNKPYSMALTAYALSLVNSKEKHKANERLVQNAVYDSAKKSRYWNAGGNALNVETAGYALMTQINLGRTGYAGPIVTYLTNQRTGGVGFVSTQDTVVALQALALYSEETAGNALDLRVKLTSEVDADWKPPEIHLTPENALLRVQFDVEKYLGGKLFVDTRGTGVGQLEVEARYNLPTSRNETCHFDLSTTVEEVKDDNGELHGPVQKDVESKGDEAKRVEKQKAENKRRGGRRKKGCKGKNKRRCRKKSMKPKKPKKPTRPPPKYQPVKSIHLKVCTRYRKKTSTGMSIMEIGILTGFEPRGFKHDKESLKKLQENLPELDKYEVSDRSLVLYLSEIPNDRELCVDVQFDREYYVGVVQAVPVKVYDYYEPDESCSKFYGPDKSSTLRLGVCDVDYPACKCSNDECPPHNPAIGNTAKLNRIACAKYHYVIKGKVAYVDEQETMVLYSVEVVQIMQQGNKDLKVGQIIDLWKREACRSLDLKKKQEYLFMGQDKGERYLDKTSFVKLWPSDDDRNIDKRNLDDFAAKYMC